LRLYAGLNMALKQELIKLMMLQQVDLDYNQITLPGHIAILGLGYIQPAPYSLVVGLKARPDSVDLHLS
jgi:hypothetical protein